MLKKYSTLIPVVILVLFLLAAGKSEELTIGLTISADPAGFYAVGDTIKITYLVQNTGTQTLNNIRLGGSSGVGLSNMTIVCTGAQISAGASMACTGVYTITQADYNAGSITTSTQVSGTEKSGSCGSSVGTTVTAQASLTIKLAQSFAMTITSDPSSYYQAGQMINYTFTLKNIGPHDLAETISVEDDHVTVTCPNASKGLPAGSSLVCNGTYTTTADDMGATQVTNTAVAVAGPHRSDPVSMTIPLNAKPALTLVKTADVKSYQKKGDVITYSFEVTNSGNVPLSELVVVDPIVPGVQCPVLTNGVIAPGETVICTGTYTIASVDVGHAIVNSAGAHGMYMGITTPSNIASVTVNFNAPFRPTGLPVATNTPQTNNSDFCYSITDVNVCLSYYPVCTTDSYTEKCKPGP